MRRCSKRLTGRTGLVVLAAAGLVVCGCASGSRPPSTLGPSTSASRPSAVSEPPVTAPLTAVADGATPSDTDAAGVEWLCRPGQANDPCVSDLTATAVPASGPSHLERASVAAKPPVDCFYVYPTVSGQPGILANLHIDPAETAVAEAQASRFSQVCRVYAPVYRQLTLHAIASPAQITADDLTKAFDSVRAAWFDYLNRYNDGRGVVVIGHSQGAAMLIALLRVDVDAQPVVRRRLVSAVILGGNVTVPIGKTVGGSFENIPACTSKTETGCVVAYSSFDQPPPADSLFGRPGQGVSYLVPIPQTPTAGLQVLCVNPASPSGGLGPLEPYLPRAQGVPAPIAGGSAAAAVSTPWVTDPDLYTGQCRYENGASWLQVSAPVHSGDPRPVVTQTLGPTWGLHLVDVNIALGNLVSLVGQQSAAYKG